MVPEIALTHQTVERFEARFPGRVALLHSRLTPGQRSDQWRRIKAGNFGIVIGSRSAVFSPQPDLGLIVIDEEHEWTYKQQDTSPRYHTRDVAERLSALTGAVVVMGSASPDLVSHYRGLRREIRLLRLPDRVATGGASVPTGDETGRLARVSVVDMREELREGNRDIFSRQLISALTQCLYKGEQAIMFLNRRGLSSFVQCRTCGAGLRCRSCDIPLTYHRSDGRLACHYCGYKRRPPSSCPKCRSYRLSYYGAGTESVAEEVSRLFPDVKVLRWDRDSTRSPRAYEEMLTGFRSGGAQVLVGTQMIAKGLHFPSVTLVGVVSADIGLNIPDYRSGERAFQLLCQVAGRAGRGRLPGRVVIQTYQPDNYAVRAAAAQDYQRFYREEIAFRREQSNPPFGRLVHLVHSHTNRAACERNAVALGEALAEQKESWGHWDVELLGPAPAYPPRLRGRYRWHIILRGQEPRALLDRVTVPTGWVVDIDPVALT
jgi:primosomal protein N' (replication factor Y)